MKPIVTFRLPNDTISVDLDDLCNSMNLERLDSTNDSIQNENLIQLNENELFSFIVPLNESDYKKNQGITCKGFPEKKLSDIQSNKTEFVSGGAFLVQVNEVQLNSNLWVQKGDYILIELKGPFRPAIAFWKQDEILNAILKGGRPTTKPFEPSQEDFAFLNDFHLMAYHRMKI